MGKKPQAEGEGKKSSKKLWIIVLAAALVLAAGGGILAWQLISRNNSQQEPTSEEDEFVESELYWNADRDEYMPKLGGATMRKPEEDGLYSVRFMVNGEFVTYRVEGKDLMNQIDKEQVMGLLVDDNGVITEMVTLDRMEYREVAKKCYVLDIDGSTAEVNTSAIGEGVSITLNFKPVTKIWNVTSTDKLGQTTELQTLDCIRAFRKDKDITDVFVITREDELNGVSVEKYCPHCDQVVKWKMWIGNASLPTSDGHWRLIRDINQVSQHEVLDDQDIIIDLNGRTIAATHKGRMIAMMRNGSKLAIMDLSEEQTGTLKGQGDGGYGTIVWIRFDNQFDLYSGTLDASEVVSSGSGTAVCVHQAEGVFNMYGGTVLGGTSQAQVDKNEETGEESTRDGLAGAVYLKGTMNMYGGEIIGGEVKSCTDSKGNKSFIAGGSMYLLGGATLNIYDGVIRDGVIKEPGYNGGIMRVNREAVVNMSGGVIENGTCMTQGGNIALYGTLNMSGGVIRGGKILSGDTFETAKESEMSMSSNIFCVNGTINMTGGLIEGHVRILDDGENNHCTVQISGDAKIKDGKRNLCLDPNYEIEFGELTAGAEIYIDGAGYVSKETVEGNRQYVHSDYDVEVLYVNKKLLIGKLSCVCGKSAHFGACNGTQEVWMPWTNKTQLPMESGNWYLLNDVEASRQFTLPSNTNIKLDLNGHKIYGKQNTRVYSLRNDNAVSMVITDLSGSGKGAIVARGQGSGIGFGNCVWVSGKSTLTMYAGTLDASQVFSTVDGVAVAVSKDCKFTMYGGTIAGGRTDTYGGAVSVSGAFELYNGTITGGTAKTYGGNVFVAANDGASFLMKGGLITGGKSEDSGGNVALRCKDGKILGGTITGGTAAYGGNLYLNNSVIMDGGTIENGKASYGGNIFLARDASFTLNDGAIRNGVASETGGNVRTIIGDKLTINGGSIENGKAKKDGGNLWMNGGALTVKGGSITGGVSEEGVGQSVRAVKIQQAGVLEDTVFTVSGGTIAGEIMMDGGAVLNLNGTPKIGIQEGSSTAYGTSWLGPVTLNGEELSDQAKVVLKTVGNLTLTGTGDERAFTVLEGVDRNKIGDDSGGDGIGNLRAEAIMCVCGKTDGHFDHTPGCFQPAAWQPWNTEISKAKYDGYVFLPFEEGSYYLTENIEGINARADVTSGQTVTLDLNGFTASGEGEGGLIYRTRNASTLNITDTSESKSGAILIAGESNFVSGRIIYMWPGSEGSNVNLFAGTLGGMADAKGTNGVIGIWHGAFTMYGGTINPIAGTTDGNANAISVGFENRSSNLTVYGGTVNGEVILNTNKSYLTIGGDAKVGIDDGSGKPHGIKVAESASARTLVCEDVSADGRVVLEDGEKFIVTGTGDERAFTVLTAGRNTIGDDSGGDGIGNIALKALMCVCGKNDGHYDHTPGCFQPESSWQPWNAEISKEKYSGYVFLPFEAGSYYLTENIEGINARADVTSGQTVTLDLNGFTASGEGEGGLIYRTRNGSTLNITDSSEGKTGAILISGESTFVSGRIIYMWPGSSLATVNLFGGTLGGTSDAKGANGVVGIWHGNFNMYGGTINPIAGTADGNANAVSVGYSSTAGALNVYGGTINGEVLLNNDKATVSVAGSAKVGADDGSGKPYGIGVAETASARPVTCDNVSADGKIVLKDGEKFVVTGTADERAFTVLNPGRNMIGDDSGGDGIGNIVAKGAMCICGKNDGHYDHTPGCYQPDAWQPWSEAISKAKYSGQVYLPMAAGSYYLTEDMTLPNRSDFSSGTVTIDLNGHKLTSTAGNVAFMKGGATEHTLNISDSVGTGVIEVQGTGSYARLIYLGNASGAVVNIFGGTFKATSDATVSQYGGMITIYMGRVNMYGGTISPCTVTDPTVSNCIAVGLSANNPKLYVYGGTIKGEVLLLVPNATLAISGDAKVGIDDGSGKPYGIGVTSGKMITFTDATGEIVLKDSTNLMISGTGDERAFTVLEPHNKVVDGSGDDGVGTLSFAAAMCTCGKVGEHTHIDTGGYLCAVPETAWKPWNGTDAYLPGAGSWFITADATVSDAILLNSSNKGEIHLDLNGHEVSSTYYRFYGMNGAKDSVITIADSVGTGKLIAKKTGDNAKDTFNGRIVWMNGTGNNATLCLYGGTFTAEQGVTGSLIQRGSDYTCGIYEATVQGTTPRSGSGASWYSDSTPWADKFITITYD